MSTCHKEENEESLFDAPYISKPIYVKFYPDEMEVTLRPVVFLWSPSKNDDTILRDAFSRLENNPDMIGCTLPIVTGTQFLSIKSLNDGPVWRVKDITAKMTRGAPAGHPAHPDIEFILNVASDNVPDITLRSPKESLAILFESMACENKDVYLYTPTFTDEEKVAITNHVNPQSDHESALDIPSP